MKGERIVSKDFVVSLEYSLKIDDELVESTSQDDINPIQFIQGYGEIIPGLEKAIEGMAIGESKRVVIAPEDAYGEYDPEEVASLSKGEFPPEIPLEVGTEIEIKDDSGEELMACIIDIDLENVLLDFNHPLAGKVLEFEVTVVGLRAATTEEIAHGHVHDLEAD